MTAAPTTGIFAIPASLYHCDDIADQPSLSASIASILCAQSPAHAKAAHPRLNPNFQRTEEAKFDVGNVCHALILEGRDAVQVIHHGDWRTNAAKEDRDNARAAGKIPLLVHQMDEVEAMCAAVKEQLAEHTASPPLFTDGKPEQTIVWEEDGVMCRARLDWLRDDHTAIDDLKTTGRSANPELYARNLFKVGGDVQAAFYLRGVKAVTGKTPVWRWVVVETTTPYALSVVTPDDEMLAIGAAKVERALEMWHDCLAAERWPGYPNVVVTASPPVWESRWITDALEDIAWAQM